MSSKKAAYFDWFPDAASRPSTLSELLRWRAVHQPDQLAYTFLLDGETQEVSLSYGELDRKARSIASLLQGMIASGDRALLLYPPGLDYIVAFFGCLYAGVVAVPTYPPDPSKLNRSLPRLQAIVADAQVSLALTTAEILSVSKMLLPQAQYLDKLTWLSTDDIANSTDGVMEERKIQSAMLAFLQYTSGSTGTPKGVMLTHANLMHNASLVYNAVEHAQTDKYVSWLPAFHDMGFMAGILQPLYAGIPACLMSPIAFLQKPLRWLQAISAYKATTSGGPNFAYDLCVRKMNDEQKATLDLGSWSVAFNGAEPIRSQTIERFATAFEPVGFRREAFYPCYGLAEATLIVSGGLKASQPVIKNIVEINQAAQSDKSNDPVVGCGRVLQDQKIVIVDPESLIERSENSVGEVWVSGPSVASGYWNRTEETVQAFCAQLADTGEGPFLRTGDLGILQHGELFIVGRIKDLIIIRGVNHYPHDIELTVERSDKALRPGCGAAFSIEVEGEERLVLVHEVDSHKQIDMDAIIDSIRRNVARRHDLHVYGVALIKAGTIPKTSSGKIQRHASRSGFLAQSLEELHRSIFDETSSDSIGVSVSREALLSASPEERQQMAVFYLRQQIAAALKLSAASIDLYRPLNALGLDSLQVIELRNQIEESLGVSLPVSRLLEGGNLSELAADLLNQLTLNGSLRPDSLPFTEAQEVREKPGRDIKRDLIDRIDSLSDEQVDLLLRQMLAAERVDG